MEQILLVVVFLLKGVPVFLPGFEPLPMATIELCEERKEFAQAYFDRTFTPDPSAPPFVLMCSTREKAHEDMIWAREQLLADPKAKL